MSEKLKFAPLVRVSTEKQAEKGSSLEKQKEMIIESVKRMGGIIPEHCWEYSGQEHATPDNERNKLDKLLRDSKKGSFDAVIVCDISRWSRDNRKSKDGLDILRKNDIKFFVTSLEYDLLNPEHCFILGMSAEIGELQSKTQSLKSINSRILRADKGRPATGKLPYGRTFDKDSNEWGVDEFKKKEIEGAAKDYLSGQKMSDIAVKLNMNHSNLHKILTKRSGNIWVQRFRSIPLKIDREVSTVVPSLLPQNTIEKILERAKGNKTYCRGMRKNDYLLSGMIFCKHCKTSLFGQTNPSGKSYYRHKTKKGNVCPVSGYLPAESIEQAIMVTVFATIGDPVGLEKAINAALPDVNEYNELIEKKKSIQKKLIEASKAKYRILDMVESGALTTDDVKERMDKNRERTNLLTMDLENINIQLDNRPSTQEIENATSKIRKLFIKKRGDLTKRILESTHEGYQRLCEMGFEEKRELLETIFTGVNNDGSRRGVYVKKNQDKWEYEVVGSFEINDDVGTLPLKPQRAREMFDILDDSINPFTGEVSNMHCVD
ncbi:MAG: recombinase family protein [Deltaproteobacteria bacterium]|nr:recombinase family protein [Candidatus Tharpella aukensis]